MKNYKVRIDMDGVLVNLKDGFLRKFCLPDPYKIYDNLGNHDLFALCKDRLPSDFWTDMDREFWRHLDPLPHAKELVEICENFFGADNVSIMSRPIEHGDCLAGKYDWILRNMPAYRRKVCFCFPKESYGGPGTILLDDYEKNVNAYRESGGKSYLVPAESNRKYLLVDHVITDLLNFLKTL